MEQKERDLHEFSYDDHMRLLMPGGAHFAFARIGHGVELWRSGRFSEVIGGSGGAIPAAMVAGNVTADQAAPMLFSWRMTEVQDVPPEMRTAHFWRRLGAAMGENVQHQLGPGLRDLGVEHWSDVEHTDATRPPGSTRNHRLGIQVSVLSIDGMTEGQAHDLIDQGKFLAFLLRNIATGHKPVRRIMPEDASAIGPAFAREVERQPIAEAVADSVRHPLAFRPRVWVEPGADRVDFILDGSLPPSWTANPWRLEVPEIPTTVALFDRDEHHPQRQFAHDVLRYPGYHILRFTQPNLRAPDLLPHESRFSPAAHLRALRMFRVTKFTLTPDQQVRMMRLGTQQAHEALTSQALKDYLGRWAKMTGREIPEIGRPAVELTSPMAKSTPEPMPEPEIDAGASTLTLTRRRREIPIPEITDPARNGPTIGFGM